MNSGSGLRSFLLVCLLCITLPLVSALPDGQTVTYSFVHISDTQSLATNYPDTYNLTFSSIESLKKTCNISAIIITGDVVNTWDDTKEWDVYLHARNLTTIPVYEIAGNHDTGGGNHYHYYTKYTGMPGENYATSVGDFDFVGINYANKTIPPEEFSRFRGLLKNSSRSYAIIATHYYMDEDGTLSSLGKDIDTYLIVRPSLVLMGHKHADFIRKRAVGGFPTVADMTNYQEGVPGGTTGWDYSAGTLYTVSSVNGRVETIRVRVIHIYPVPSFGEEMTVFTRDPGALCSADRFRAAGTLSRAYPVLSCGTGGLFCNMNEFFQQCWTNVWHVFS
jgi:predicted MPP superfamily phosphohydrolase